MFAQWVQLGRRRFQLDLLVSLLLSLGGLLIHLVADSVAGSLETGTDTSVGVLGLFPGVDKRNSCKRTSKRMAARSGDVLVGFLGGSSGSAGERLGHVICSGLNLENGNSRLANVQIY